MPKINDKFYKGEDGYSDGDIEKELFEMVSEGRPLDDIVKNDNRWPVYYHLTFIRRNLLEWYPFRKESNVLEIGAGCGALTGLLTEKCSRVVSLELSRQRADVISARYPDAENLEIVIANLEDFDTEEKFDYITLIGVLEYAGSFINALEPYKKLLETVKKYLKPEGVLFVAIENRLGLKYFAGAGEDHTGNTMEGPEGYPGNPKVQTFGRLELKKLLSESGFENQSFYYPHPDYKLPTEIFSEKQLPGSCSMLPQAPNYDRPRLVTMNETLVYENLIKNGLYEDFANSFLVVCGAQGEENVVYSTFNRERKIGFQMETSIIENSNKRFVTKKALSSSSIPHLQNLRDNHETLCGLLFDCDFISCKQPEEAGGRVLSFEYLTKESAASQLIERYRASDRAGFLDIIRKFTEILYKGLKTTDVFTVGKDEQWLFDGVDTSFFQNSGEFMTVSCLDIVFSNVFIDGDKISLIDQEWLFKSTLPVKFVIFRAFNYFYNSKYHLMNIASLVPIDELYEMYSISTQELEVFSVIEENFQKYVVDTDFAEAVKGYSKAKYNIKNLTPVLEHIYADSKWDGIETNDFTVNGDLVNLINENTANTNQSILLTEERNQLVEEIESLRKRTFELHDSCQEMVGIIDGHRKEILELGDHAENQRQEILALGDAKNALIAEVHQYRSFLGVSEPEEINKYNIRAVRIPSLLMRILSPVRKVLRIFR